MATRFRAMTFPARWLALAGAAAATIAVGSAACSGGGNRNAVPFYVNVSGTAVDWKTGAPVAAASIVTVGITPVSQTETAADGTFTLPGIPINGYVILDMAAVGYARTFSPAMLVGEENLTGVTVELVASGDAGDLRTGFGITNTSGRGAVLGRTEDSASAPIAGVAALQVLPVTFASDGPYFLADDGTPAPAETATTANGGFLFFNVSTGNVAVQAAAAGFVFQPIATIVEDNAWSLVTLAADGTGNGTPTPTPTGTPAAISFANDVYPIFSAKGCSAGSPPCHRSGQPAGGMRLDQDPNQIHPGVVQRVNTANPAASLLLTKPLFEATPDHGGGNIFLTTSDPDYLTILGWIEQGANNN